MGTAQAVASVLVVLVAGYGALVHLGLLGLTLSSFAEARVYRRRRAFAAYDESFADPLARGVSLVVALHDRAADVAELVRSMASLRYPEVEVVVVDDGSSDGTAEVLVEAMRLQEVPVLGTGAIPVRGAVERRWYGRRGTTPVTLLRKAPAGVADAWNAAADAARHPIVVVVDSHAVLDPDALLLLARPFNDDPQRVVAATGVVRPLNGCRTTRGRVTAVAMPRSWLGVVQVVAYLESYLVERAGWSSIGALPRLSREVAAFRRDRLREVGGWRADLAQPHVELAARLHRWAGDNARPSRLVFVGEPVAWFTAPETVGAGVSDAATHQRDVTTGLRAHLGMLGRPRHGAAGLLAYPWMVLVGVLAPAVEALAMVLGVVGLVSVALAATGLGVGVVGTGQLALLALAWPVSGVLVGWAGLVVDEVSLTRYQGLADLGRAVVGVVLLQTVWRWLVTVPRLRASLAVLRSPAAARPVPTAPEVPPRRRLGVRAAECHTGESAPVHAHRR